MPGLIIIQLLTIYQSTHFTCDKTPEGPTWYTRRFSAVKNRLGTTNPIVVSQLQLMTSSINGAPKIYASLSSLVHIGASLARQLITTCMCANLSDKCSSQIRVLLSLQQHTIQYNKKSIMSYKNLRNESKVCKKSNTSSITSGIFSSVKF